jgi:phosphoribosylanthranilate isomerase
MIEIKICGLTNLDDAVHAAEYGADAVGFIFHQCSPRYISPDSAKAIIQMLPDNIVKVGVFVNQTEREVKHTVNFCGLDLIQLHGDESPQYCSCFPSEILLKAVSAGRIQGTTGLELYPVKAFVMDAHDPIRYGGTGKKADWALAAGIREMYPLILAGGLHENNIMEAVRCVRPHAVDVNSGIEVKPGEKNHDRMRKIIEMVKKIEGLFDGALFGKLNSPAIL